MEIRLLKKGYKKNEQFYKDFLEDKIKDNEEYFSGEVVNINETPDFPIYIAKGSESVKKELFIKAFNIISDSYLNIERDIHMDEVFWHSLLCVYKRDFLIKEYPEIAESYSSFCKVAIKKFDWENYIYKCILAAQYINDNVTEQSERQRYQELIVDNLDVYNYIIKYEIFRNEKFLLNILDIIDELDLAKIMKAKIKDRPELGKDERVGRRVLFEFNKSYPVVMAPMSEKEDLKEVFLEYLSYYYTEAKVNEDEVKSNKSEGLLSRLFNR